MMQVNVKWGKQVFEDVEVDLDQPPLVFKSQLFTLSGVLPERQKVMVKAKLLKDDAWDSVPKLKNGQTVLLMGSAEGPKVEPPPEPVQFVEDMPEDEQDLYDLKKYGAGLKNLGNTCYMNATMQLLFSVQELRQSLVNYDSVQGGVSAAANLSAQLTAAAGGLFKDMTRSGTSVMPVRFLMILRLKYPQFAEVGREGIHKQQDAEECFSQVAQSLTETLKVDPEDASSISQLHELFGIDLVTHIKCQETEESITIRSCETKLKCNIPQNPPIHHIHEGITEGMKADRTQRSEMAQRDVLFEGHSEIEKLPAYVMLHMVRFSYRRDTQQRAKILRKVTYPAVMDLYEFCTSAYKQELDGPRKKFEELRTAEIGQKKNEKPPADDESSAEPQAQSSEPAVQEDVEMEDASAPLPNKALTGRYQLMGVLTHKGRSADSGHYVAWVKHEDNQWIEYDDEDLIPAREEEIMQLSGGGDWHMAYLLLFKAERVDMSNP